jgi:hypothetical protein
MLVAMAAISVFLVVWTASALADDPKNTPRSLKIEQVATPSGAWEFRDMDLGTNIT